MNSRVPWDIKLIIVSLDVFEINNNAIKGEEEEKKYIYMQVRMSPIRQLRTS